MNQILITEKNTQKTKQKKTKTPREPGSVSGIVKVFATLILIFGIALSGNGAYAFMQSMEAAQNMQVPIVSITRKGNTAHVLVQCNTGIKTVSYSWNDSVPTIIQGKGRTELEQPVTIQFGENRLNISVMDSKGQTKKYVKTLKQESKDITEPVIAFETVGSKVKIVATDDTEIDYITYKYGDTQEVTIQAETEGQTTIEELVTVTQGENSIIVEAVDKAQNVATKEQLIKGTKKPTVSVVPDTNDQSYVIMKVEDEDGLRMISFTVNGQQYKTDPNVSLNTKTWEYKLKIEQGQTDLKIHAYNINEQVTEYEVPIVKQ